MRELEGYRKALAHLPQYIREAEAEAEKTVRTEAVVSGGISKGMEFSAILGTCVPVISATTPAAFSPVVATV